MRVLFLLHAHPQLQAGGTEIFSHNLFRSLRNKGIKGVFLAGTAIHQRPPSPGTPFQQVGNRSDEILIHTNGFDTFYLSQVDLHGMMPPLEQLLREINPDLIHIHHIMALGVETIPLIRRILPKCKIVMTLHDYYPICANDGQMVKTYGGLCNRASLDACKACFPEKSGTEFRLRFQHIRNNLDGVDKFIAPSNFLKKRYTEWGIDPSKLEYIPNGIVHTTPAIKRMHHKSRNNFGFFGHINRFKGAMLALEASAILSRRGIDHNLTLHGSTAYQTKEFIALFEEKLEQAPSARFAGSYTHDDLPRLMEQIDWVVFPSIWWENAPLVIGESFLHGRPVISSNIGGAAEMVEDHRNGLHFAFGQSLDLARVMEKAQDPILWNTVSNNITPPPSIEECADLHLRFYENILRLKERIA